MKKIIYIHGLGGSGNGTSAKNVKKFLENTKLPREIINDDFCVEGNTYNLLNPMESFNQIKEDILQNPNVKMIVASSLGGFYASALETICPTILLNPCLCPKEAIPPLLYPEQRKDFDEKKCFEEWTEIQKLQDELSIESKTQKVGIFADKDEYFSYKNLFKNNFTTSKNSTFENAITIYGTHEIAKDENQLKTAISNAIEYFEILAKS